MLGAVLGALDGSLLGSNDGRLECSTDGALLGAELGSLDELGDALDATGGVETVRFTISTGESVGYEVGSSVDWDCVASHSARARAFSPQQLHRGWDSSKEPAVSVKGESNMLV